MKLQILAVLVSAGMLFTLGCAQEKTNKSSSSSSDEQVQTEELNQNQAVKQGIVQAMNQESELATTPANLLCAVSGPAGTTVDCPVKIGAEAGGAVAIVLQADLSFNTELLTFEGFYKNGVEIANGATGINDRGHILRHSNLGNAEEAGRVRLMILKMTQPFAAISDAAEGAEEELITARFATKADVRGTDASKVSLGGIVAASEAAEPIAARVANATIITGALIR